MNGPATSERWEREILDLHRFFRDWLRADLPQTSDAFDRLARVLADGFTIVMPSGAAVDREALLRSLWAAHGSRPELQISIRRPALHYRDESALVATYEEWQRGIDGETGRISTVVFGSRGNAPNGLEWLHVHETWLPDGGDDG